MPRSAGQSRVPEESHNQAAHSIRAWAESRAVVLVAIGVLFALVAVLIVISLIHPR